MLYFTVIIILLVEETVSYYQQYLEFLDDGASLVREGRTRNSVFENNIQTKFYNEEFNYLYCSPDVTEEGR
jgi:hypothetical protein